MNTQRIAKDLPLSELTLRRYEKPGESQGRDLVRKMCLSLGLLQPGDSRDVVVDVFMVLLQARKGKEELHSDMVRERVIELRKQHGLQPLGIAHSNIRRQLRRLKDLFLVEANSNMYRVTEFMPLTEVFHEKGEGFLLQAVLTRVREYLKKVDEEFS
jgi:DNA-binding transcriptional ArsR family regulator